MPITRPLARAVPLSLSLLSLTAGGCDSPKGDLGEYTATGTEGTTGDDGTTTMPVEPATSTGPTGGAETDSGDPIDPGCGEPADPNWESATLVFDPPVINAEFAGACTITQFDLQSAEIDLDCGDQKVEVRLSLAEPLAPLFAVGDTLALDYRSRLVFGESVWFTLRRTDVDATLLLAGLHAETLEPPDTQAFFAPLTMAMHEGVCPAPITCEDMEEPIAIEFEYQGATAELLPGHIALLGEPAEYRLDVSQARKFHNDLPDGHGGFCSVTDVPTYYFQTLVRRVAD